MSNHSRTKGHSFEREIARQFQEMGWDDAMTKRAARGGDWSTTDDGIDIVNVEPFAIQCKRFKGYAPISCIEEIKTTLLYTPFATGRLDVSSQIPILITKADNKPTMAVLPWADAVHRNAKVETSRRGTVHRCHVSEAHHIKDAESVLAATMGALVPGGPLTMETTANGMAGVYYDLWAEAEAKANDFLSLFYGYQHHEDYRIPVPNDFVVTTDEEKYLAIAEGMSPEALLWRRGKKKESGMRQFFKHEFPATAQEAFLTSGRSRRRSSHSLKVSDSPINPRTSGRGADP